MELQIQNFTLSTSLVLTGLSAGLFFAWSVSVIPGTHKIEDLNYLYSMQSINREILNPGFFLVFFGSLIALICSTLVAYGDNPKVFGYLLAATMVYLIGTVGITAFGNVPLNNKLESLDIEKLASGKVVEFRSYYESLWNQFHTYRMLFSILTFILTLIAYKIQLKQN